ncbi:hypothetical protein [Pseudactinotalea sp. HY160]|uniref:hypothetical protein n=1 Tax=Pseudactinotalea sp. HY160 TaxID=2654490 RepID=UPI00188379E6|nr:hypothetical protein [Pseudactinotalea sp. HY160]
MAHASAIAQPTQVEVEDRLAFADAALALAGHEVTDPMLRTMEEATAAFRLVELR